MIEQKEIEKPLTPRQLLTGRYPEGEYILMQEVSDESGFSRSRSLDWMVAAIWQSRGHAITGIEQKSNRGDWLKEIKNPQKQENHFKYCDYFYLFTTHDNVAKLEEIPMNWGWLHSSGNRIKEMKKAVRLEPVQPTRSFLIAMMRRAASKKNYILRDEIDDTVDKLVKDKVSSIMSGDQAAKSYKKLRETLDLFQKESGLDIERGWYHYYDGKSAGDIGKIVKMLFQGGTTEIKEKLEDFKSRAQRIINSIDNDIKEMKL